MMGDWIKGTQVMSAQMKGVYIGLLIYQYDNGHIPEDVEELVRIEPEVVKVWDKLKAKFPRVAPGQLKNIKLEEVRNFWNKQSKNGRKGGRPKNENPKHNPNNNPKPNPNHNLQYDHDLDTDFELKFKEAFDEIFIDQEKLKWPHLDFDFEFRTFCNKVRGSPDEYRNRDTGSIRLAFQYQLRTSKGKKNGNPKNKQSAAELAEAFAKRHGAGANG